ncbi:MAG: MG2 domain-containing protein, partial [Acidimicrobiia bacterium]|nr:MG2 domain-containing protein [Acidimicrobiia bacterium]
KSGGGQDTNQALPGWPVLLDTVLKTDGKRDVLVDTKLDLAKLLGGNLGHAVVVVEPTTPIPLDNPEAWNNPRTITWVQATGLGVDAFADSDQLAVWVTGLLDGSPKAGVALSGIGDQLSGSTDGDGLARLALPPGADVWSGRVAAVLATLAGDSAILPANTWYGRGWASYPRPDERRWYVVDDRGLYRPGETAKVKGWIRTLSASTDRQIRVFGGAASVNYSLFDAQGVELASGQAPLGPLGGFDLSLALPADANLGLATLHLDTGDPTGSSTSVHSFRIDEFRRPEFEVKARTESPGPYVSNAPATVAVDATYYSGGPLGGAPVQWQVSRSSATYSPPGWDDFSFGVWTPWWVSADPFGQGWFPDGGFVGDGSGRGRGLDYCCGPFPGGQPDQAETFSGVTDAAGHHYLQIDFEGDTGRPDLPISVKGQSTVTDVNRQAWASSTDLIVQPASLTVGLRSTRTFVRSGEKLAVEAVVTDLDGEAVAGRSLDVTAGRVEGSYENGEWVDKVVDVQTCSVTTAEGPVDCSFDTAVPGTYRIASTVVDDQGGRSRSELTRWVSGATATPERSLQAGSVQVVPGKAEYAPGDTAELLVQAPFGGTGLATIARDGIVRTERFDVTNGSAVLQIPVGEADVPNLWVGVEVVGATPRVGADGKPIDGAAARPAYATGGVELSVSTATRSLTVKATPRDAQVSPGGSTSVDLAVTDASGAPVGDAEVALIVVDESVLSLTGYTLADPLDAFYGHLQAGVSARYGRSHLRLQDAPVAPGDGGEGASSTSATAGELDDQVAKSESFDALRGAAPSSANLSGRDGASADTAPSPIPERSNFDALAVFAPSVSTGADGTASVAVTVPDSLTRYRVMAVAVHGENRFGSTTAGLTARLPIMVRPSAPRFANFGDTFELPVVVQNGTDAARTVDVAVQVANLDATGAPGVRVEVPANDRVEVRFPMAAAQAGTARFRVAAVSASDADAAAGAFPVYTPATAEAFATYGVVDAGS